MSQQTRIGIAFALVTAIISGFSIFYNKLVIVKGIDPLIFNILKNGGVGLVLTLLLIRSQKLVKIKKLTFSTWQKLIAIAIIGGSIPFILYFEGLRQVSATNANLIHKTLFIWVAAMAVPILGERLNLWQVIGYILVAWSNLFIGGFSGFSFNTGELMILAATLLWSVENIIAKVVLNDTDSFIVAWGRMFLGSLILVGVAISQNKLNLISNVTPEQLRATAGSIIFLSGYVLTWYKALQLAPATSVTSVLVLSTPITNVLSAIFITHSFPQQQFSNMLITTLGVILIAFLHLTPFKKLLFLKVKTLKK